MQLFREMQKYQSIDAKLLAAAKAVLEDQCLANVQKLVAAVAAAEGKG